MGGFIDFFLENPFLIIVLIGVLTSMLGKKKQTQDPGTPPKKKWQEVMRELQGEMPQGNQQQKHAPPPVRKVEQQAAQAVEVIDETKNEANKRITELRRLQQKYDQERLYQKAKADQLTSTISDNDSPVYRKGPSFGKKQLIDGIIMSEVLGPPRAKRSLHRSRR
jgi:Fe2+ transport system protein B